MYTLLVTRPSLRFRKRKSRTREANGNCRPPFDRILLRMLLEMLWALNL